MASASFALLVVFVTLLGAAVLVYPGGSTLDPGAESFAFWTNYWCDLLDRHAPDGASNASAALLVRLAFAALAGCLLAFWPAIAPLLRVRRLVRWMVGCGTVSAVGMAALAVIGYEADGIVHTALLFCAGPLGLAAAAFGVIGSCNTWPGAGVRNAAATALLVTGFANTVVYAWVVVNKVQVSALLPVIQKLAAISFVVWVATMLSQARSVRR